jgi:hypothetical protein
MIAKGYVTSAAKTLMKVLANAMKMKLMTNGNRY